eukprot:g11265.t1
MRSSTNSEDLSAYDQILSLDFASSRCCAAQQEELVRWSRAEFFEVLQARAKSLDDPQALRFDKILSVRKAGPDVALIKLQVGLPPVLYTDFLSMLRLNGRWWIIAKSSDGEPGGENQLFMALRKMKKVSICMEVEVITYFPELETGSMKALEGLRWMGNAAKATDTQRVEKANAAGLETDPASTWISKRADEGEPFAGPHLPPLARSPRPPLPGPTKKLPEKLPPIGARWGMG